MGRVYLARAPVGAGCPSRREGGRAGGFRARGGGSARQGAHAAVGPRADDVEDARVAIGVVVGEDDVGRPVVRLLLVVVFGVPGGVAGMGAEAAKQGGEEGEEKGLEEARIPGAIPPHGALGRREGELGMRHERNIEIIPAAFKRNF